MFVIIIYLNFKGRRKMAMGVKRIAVTGGSGQIAYSLLFRLAAGDLLGKNQPISLYIRDLKECQPQLEGLAMELEDCAFPLLHSVKIGSEPEELFDGADIVFLVGAKPRTLGQERKDLLLDNGKIFVQEGRALNEAASKDVKVLVVGNPCNTNCLIAVTCAQKLSRRNFHAMMRLDQNRAAALLAKKSKGEVSKVSSLTIWGNHSATQVPDYINAKIGGKKVPEVILDHKWLSEDFMSLVQKRGAAVIAARGKSSAASAANAALDAMRELFVETPKDTWFTTAITSDDNPYGIEPNLVFGFPCRSNGKGDVEIVKDLPWDFLIREKIAATQKELLEERSLINELLKR